MLWIVRGARPRHLFTPNTRYKLLCAVVHGDSKEELAQVDLVLGVRPLRGEDACPQLGPRLHARMGSG